MRRRFGQVGLGLVAVLASGCGLPGMTPEQVAANTEQARQQSVADVMGSSGGIGPPGAAGGTSVMTLFGSDAEPQRQIGVNRYLWAASLDILSFLPLEGADPFSGVIATDWGRIAGDPVPYRVTVFISEAALDARSLRVAAFRQQGGRAVPVAAADNRKLEDAILTRARQLRIASDRR